MWLSFGFYSSATPAAHVTPLPVKHGEILCASKAWTMYMDKTVVMCCVSSLVQREILSMLLPVLPGRRGGSEDRCLPPSEVSLVACSRGEQDLLPSLYRLEYREEDPSMTIFPPRAITLSRHQLQHEFWHLGPCSSSPGCSEGLSAAESELPCWKPV